MGSSGPQTTVIRNGTLIDGSGKQSARNDAIVIAGTRIKSVGPLPPDIQLDDRKNVHVIDAAGKWIMPGLIDAHCHMSYGYPLIKGEGKGKGTTRPEFSTLKSARSARRSCARASPASRCRAEPGSPMSACAMRSGWASWKARACSLPAA
jgi:imidazolonepropionase-like amidohydrolase